MPVTSRFASAAARAYGMFRIAAAAAVDPFFNYVTALLHGDGTNGAQNNTFLDSSTNNFTITRNGNTTQGTFSPFSQTGWSNYFDGSGDYINFTNQATTGSFTCECWFYRGENVGGYNIIFGGSNAGSANPNNVQLTVDNSGGVGLTLGGTGVISLTGTAVTRNAWNHIAWVRSGTSCAIFVNGLRIGTGTSSAALNVDRIGTAGALGPGTYDALGYISNARITTTAVYDVAQTTCTVPTTPLTAISGTYLLTLQSNRFVDNSASPLTLTVNGTPSVQAFSPFNPTSAWSASSNGGSGYFDGSGDYLSIAYNSALDLGGSDFTVEGWVYSTNNGSALLNVIDFGWQFGVYGPLFVANTSGTLLFYASSNGSSWDIGNATTIGVLPLNSWNHFAISRNGTSIRVFFNGALVTTITTSAALMSNASRAITIGGDTTGAYNFGGYISGLRVVKGSSVYNAAFSVPTAPPTAVTNTQLLTNFTNAGIYDNAAVGDYETVGNAQVSTSVVKYGTGSMYFDGTGDYLVANTPVKNVYALGAGDFTIECWVYFNSISNTPQFISGYAPPSTTTYNWAFYLPATGTLAYYLSSTGTTWDIANGVSFGTPFATGVWYHIALVRVGGKITPYVNGTAGTSTTSTATIYNNNGPIYVGGISTYVLNGYIDDFRFTKGIGRYPYNFTPPTAAFPNIGGTVTLTADPYFRNTTLLLPGNGTNGAQNNTFLDSSSNAFTITRNGNTTQGTFTPFSQTGWSVSCAATGDYISTPDNAAFTLGSSDFTIECWINTTSTASNYILGQLNSTFTTSSISFYIQAGVSQTVQAYVTSGGSYYGVQTATGLVQPGQWTHIAFVRDGATLRLYVNGTQQGTASISTLTVQDSTNAFSIGRAGEFATNTWLGYVSNVRIIKGTCLYPSGTTFTPSTTPLTAVSGTSLLTCQSNRFVDNSSNALAFTSAGTVSVQAFSPFAPTAAYSASTVGGSGYFDGSGDYLQLADSTAWDLTGDYTIEMWLYVTSTPSSPTFFQLGETSNYLLWYLASATKYLTLTGTAGITASTAMSLNVWNHVALVRNGSGTNNTVMYLNGVNVGQTTNNTSFTGSASNGVRIGAEYPSGFYVNGYISDVRVVKGTAVYTANFTPPTAPLTAITNTQLLLNYTNGGIVDATAKNDLETVGNAQISTTQSKFGGSSMYFDGTGDRLTIPFTNDFLELGIGGQNFTVEAWIYPTNTMASVGQILSKGGGTASWSTTSGAQYQWGVSSSALSWQFNSSGAAIAVNSGTVTLNAWQHVAVSYDGTTTRTFLNGVLQATSTSSYTAPTTRNLQYIGMTQSGGFTQEFYGYIDDLRITKGIARYTSNFTPPTSAFLLQ